MSIYARSCISAANHKQVCGCKIFSDRLGTRSVKTATTRGKIMEMQDTLINKIASEICGKEREIVNDFCKAFIAQKCLDGFTISTIFDHYQLCVCHDFSQTHSSKYWFEKRDNQPERSKREDSDMFYVLYQISPSGQLCREGEMNSKEEAQKWVDLGVSNGFNRCWHEHSRDAVL